MSLRDFFEDVSGPLSDDEPADGLRALLRSGAALRGSQPGLPVTAQDILDAMELERQRIPEPRPYLVHPTELLHLEEHGMGDPSCDQCVTIWMHAEIGRGLG